MNEKEALSEIEKEKRKLCKSTKNAIFKLFNIYFGRWALTICPTCKDLDNCTLFDRITETTDTFIKLTFQAFMDAFTGEEDVSNFLNTVQETLSNTVEAWKTKGDFK